MSRVFYLLIAGLFLDSGCAPVYIPSAPMVFNNDKKGDYSVNYRQGFYSSNLQVGYAVNDNLNVGGTLSALYTGDASVGSILYEGLRGIDFNAVVGYYNKFYEYNIFELNAGVGPIAMDENLGLNNYLKAYIQPSITFNSRGETRTDFTLLTRVVGTSFSEAFNRDTVVNLGYVEPVLSLSIGNQLRFNTQLGISLPFNQEYLRDYSPFIFNMGIGYTILKTKKEVTEP
ncbi:hypothetical protein N8368_04490 [Bacteroidia bacterium]|nr:hypothetical protein [Bacteroidia bacterium]MDC1395744.1 hypothetical protein [Bacteroidia bacterium]